MNNETNRRPPPPSPTYSPKDDGDVPYLPYVVKNEGRAIASFATYVMAEDFATTYSRGNQKSLIEVTDVAGTDNDLSFYNGLAYALKYKAVFSACQWRIKNAVSGGETLAMTQHQAIAVARFLNGLSQEGVNIVWLELLSATKECLKSMGYTHMDAEEIQREISLGNQMIIPIKHARIAIARAEAFINAKPE